jgi:hypothetical protein
MRCFLPIVLHDAGSQPAALKAIPSQARTPAAHQIDLYPTAKNNKKFYFASNPKFLFFIKWMTKKSHYRWM